MEFTEIEKIEAIGNFLMNYNNDLNWYMKIKNLKEQKGKEAFGLFLINFLTEWKVIRSIPKEIPENDKKRQKIFDIIYDFELCDQNKENVNKLVDKIKDITETELVSLSSKVLFIHSPDFYFPYDRLVKKALNITSNNYSTFYDKVNEIKNERINDINKILNEIKIYTDKIEFNFKNKKDEIELTKLNKIRQNRIVDKLLWSKGKNS